MDYKKGKGMKICLLIPPSADPRKIPERVYGCTYSYYPQPELPMLYVAARLRQDGHAVTLLDCTEKNSWDAFAGLISSSDFDAYVLHTVLLAESADIRAGKFITENTEATVVYFGPHPTLYPDRFLFHDRAIVARGEAEHIISDLFSALGGGDLSGVRGISFRRGGRNTETDSYGVITDINTLPFPARDLLQDRDKHFNPKLEGRPVTLVLTSRGCSFQCYYCVPNAISWARELEWKRFNKGKKPPVTLRSPGNIIAEFEEIKKQGYRAVSIIDDMFLFGGKARVLELCRGLKQVGMPFGGLARCDLILDEEMVKALAEAGCRYIDLGIESLDQAVLDDIKKNMKVEKVEPVIRLLTKYGIEPKPNIMFGASPLETRETIRKTIGTISDYPVQYCMFAIATPFPGTGFAEKAEAEGWAVEPEIHDLEKNLSPTEKSLITYPHLSKEELERAVKEANRRFYLHPKRIWYQLRKIRSLRHLIELMRTGWKVVK